MSQKRLTGGTGRDGTFIRTIDELRDSKQKV
jgi:hypothetical protein